jgi:hypothetical protein
MIHSHNMRLAADFLVLQHWNPEEANAPYYHVLPARLSVARTLHHVRIVHVQLLYTKLIEMNARLRC